MEFAPSENETMIRTMVRDFVEAELRPVVEENERLGRFPAAVVEKMASLGLLGIVIPEECGGAGLDTVSYAAAIDEVARVCASTAVTLSVTNSVCAYPIFRFGTEAQKKKYLRPLATGQIIGGFCLTEPGAGSDPGGIRARAVRKGASWILNGEKAWVTNVEVA